MQIRSVVQRLDGLAAEWVASSEGTEQLQASLGRDEGWCCSVGRFWWNAEASVGSASSGPPGTDAAILCLIRV
jgi:hypothetical protein